MAYQTQVSLRKGEQRVLYAKETASSGTLTIQTGTPPTFTLYDSSGAIVSTFNAVAATGYDNASLAAVQVWYNLDTSTLTAGTYIGIFKYSVLSSADGIIRKGSTAIEVTVLSPVEIAATYDASNPTSNKDTVRRRVSDTDMSRPIWSDGEINAALAENGSIPNVAAAQLLEDAAGDASRKAIIIRLGTDSWDRTRIAEQLRETAKRLRDTARVAPLVDAPDAVFTMLSDDGATPGTLDVW